MDQTTPQDVLDAYGRIRAFIHRTPLIHSRSFSEMTGADVYIKAENLQKTGSFKARGVFNKLLQEPAERVITASMGNHAQALAYAARTLGRQATIVMPVNVAIVKEEATQSYGAEVVLHGETLGEALEYALSMEGYAFVHPFDDYHIIAGQGTLAVEVLEDLPNIDAVLVPVGGGGLIAGTAVAVKNRCPGTEVLGVQTESAPSGYRSFSEGRITEAKPRPSLADGIAVGRIGERPFSIIKRLVDDVILVREEEIALSVLYFMERKKLVVEGAGAAPFAALLSNPDRFKGRRIVLVASGGNIDLTLIDRIVRKGLVTGGRIALFEVVLDDAPGSLHTLTGIIAANRTNILDVSHNRITEDLPIGKTQVTFTVEARTREAFLETIQRIEEAGFTVREK